MGIMTIASRAKPMRSLIVVYASGLVSQWESRVKDQTEFSVGTLESGNIVNPDADVIIALNDSILAAMRKRDAGVLELLASVDMLFVDESHRLPTNKSFTVALKCEAPYRFGLSATQFSSESPKENLRDMKLIGALGDLIVDIPSSYLRNTINPDTGETYLRNPPCTFLPCSIPQKRYGYRSKDLNRWVDTSKWHKVEKDTVIENAYRNEMIRRLIYWRLQEEPSRKFLILVAKHAHGNNLQNILSTAGIASFCWYGGGHIQVLANGDPTALEMSPLECVGS